MMVCLILLPLFSYSVQKNSGIINVLINNFLILLEFMSKKMILFIFIYFNKIIVFYNIL
jgi:hypothetical protein